MIKRLLAALALATLLASALAYLAPWNWAADLLVNFRVQYAVFGILLATMLGALRAWRPAAVAALGSVLSAPAAWASLAPVPIQTASAPGPADTQPLRVVSANVFFFNERHREVIDWARAAHADVLVFIEVTGAWSRALHELTNDYPYRFAPELQQGYGIQIFSRWPLTSLQLLTDGPRPAYGLVTSVRRGAVECRFYAVHLTWPLTPARAVRRAAQLRALAAQISAQSGPVVALGDFNTSPFSPVFAELLARSRTVSAARGLGWQPTWPRFLPPFGIQIDHVLLNGKVRARNFRRSDVPGSDHRALIVDLAI